VTFAESTGQYVQSYKFGSKEFDTMHGLNQYDFHARQYDPAIGRFTTVDPLAEIYYSISPYAYCSNNPLKYIDPTGMAYFKNQSGNIIWDESDDDTYEHEGEEYENVGNYYYQDTDFGYIMWYKNNIYNVQQASVFETYDPSAFRGSSIWETWAQSDNLIASFTYDYANDVYIVLQGFSFDLIGGNHINPLTGKKAFSNIDGSANYNGLNSLTSTIGKFGVPASRAQGVISNGLGHVNKIGAAQFSKVFAGNLSRLPAKTRGFINKYLNKAINFYNEKISTGQVMVTTTSVFRED